MKSPAIFLFVFGCLVILSCETSAQIFSSPKVNQKQSSTQNPNKKNAANSDSVKTNPNQSVTPQNESVVWASGNAKVVRINPNPKEKLTQPKTVEAQINLQTEVVAQVEEPQQNSVENKNPAENISAGEAVASNSTVNLEALKKSPKSPVELYRVGVGDVLDIKLLNTSGKDSTLYTILENGILDYPLAGEPLRVAGLTIGEINELLATKVKLYEKPKFLIGVREYASHQITLSGLVDKPGTKILRREAVPLYAVLAEAGQQAAATKAIIRRGSEPLQTIALKDLNDETLVYAGDIIQVTAEAANSAAQFYFISGGIVSPGQKEFHNGLTLTQAVFASGGTAPKAGHRITIFRQNSEGLLVSTEYNLKEIKNGKVPDPQLQAGDRLEVGN